MNNPPPRTILVTGDPICENNYYRGNRRTADSAEKRGFRVYQTPGGALMLKQLIETATASDPSLKHWRTEFGLKLNFKALPKDYHAYCLWEPQISNPTEKDEKKRFEVWRAVEPTLGYGQKEPEPLNEAKKATFRARRTASMGTSRTLEAPDIVVIDDPGLDFRNGSSKERWPVLEKREKGSKPSWVVLKLSGSIGEGDLWDKLVDCCDDNLVVIVPADQLRHSDLRLSSALSWEATVEDVLAELKYNPALKPLLAARHAIITFKSDGAFWLNNDKVESSRMLVFDSANAEGDWSALQGRGTVFGFLSCFTAAIVSELCRNVDDKKKILDLEKVLAAGLGASRELRRLGHGLVKTRVPDNPEKYRDNPNPGFPFQEIATRIHKPTDKFVSSPVPADNTDRGKWMMLNAWLNQAQATELTRPHYEAALAAMLGPDGLERVPVARFGNLLTVDRSEIESLRSLRQLILSYQAAGVQKKPLSIGVFGPPGAGKSFGVTEISKAVFGEKLAPLTFNLSQFSNPTDLVGAFHLVRDRVLTGETPVVFWDEFDSQNYRWLQFLLAPMQDGAFQEGQIHHPIGKCIFIFAGATSPTFEHFGPLDPSTIDDEPDAAIQSRRLELEQQWRDFILKKGPDFKSRLAGYLNVLGPNRRQTCRLIEGARQWNDDPHDIYFPIRRAFFIRSQFKLKDSQRLKIDPGILRALLEIPQYKAGARSLEFLCQHLRQSTPDIPRRSHLPGDYLLDMHVNAAAFWRLCERDLAFRDAAKQLAPGLHEDWYRGLSDEERRTNPKAKPWSDSDPDTRNANLAQALRIPELLAVTGFQVVEGDPLPLDQEERVRQMLREHAEIIAEAEHNHWMVERLFSGWRYAPIRDNDRKQHPLLVPYGQLPDSEKNKDLVIIYGRDDPYIPDVIERLKKIGWRIEARL